MELAGRVYDVVTHPMNAFEVVNEVVPRLPYELEYWRRVLRMAALCHDMGHLSFSHAGEKELLSENWDHERLTLEIIRSPEMESIWQDIKIQTEDVAKLAVGPEKYGDATFSDWEAILSEIIVGDAFGVDRMDYLLRDSLHAGVAYGRFDHYRLIDTLRILPRSEGDSLEPALGVEEGGLHSAEALLNARYFMFTQLYFHHVRRIYDIHLKDFLKEWIGEFPTEVETFLKITDNEVLVELRKASSDPKHRAHDDARRIMKREHFRRLYSRNPVDLKKTLEPGKAIYEAACEKFGKEAVRHDKVYPGGGEAVEFPVLTGDGRISSSTAISQIVAQIPPVAVDYVFIDPKLRDDAERWLRENRDGIISAHTEEAEELEEGE